MTPATQILLDAFDGHDIEGVRAALDAGADPVSEQDGKKPIHWLLEQYWRSDHLPHCLKLLLDRGATLPDTLLVAVLLDDAEAVKATIQANPLLLKKNNAHFAVHVSRGCNASPCGGGVWELQRGTSSCRAGCGCRRPTSCHRNPHG